jgi:flagellar protein FliL
MANEELLDELDEELLEGEGEETGAKNPKLRLIILIVIALLLAGGAGFYFMQGAAPDEGVATDGAESEAEAKAKVEALATPYYFSLNPPFVVNFVGKGRAKFLQVNIDGLTRNPSVKEDITTHLPHIRNNVVFLLSSKRYDDLITPEGKEELRKQVLEEIRNILTQETGNGDVEDIYFTSFVMQ